MEKNKIPKIIARNKADSLFTIVGAASILAKVERDALIDSYRPQFAEYGDIGSGYSSDETTIQFLKKYITKNKKPPVIARKSWATTENLVRDLLQQTRLTDFLGKK
jgi:ribonuclease HII